VWAPSWRLSHASRPAESDRHLPLVVDDDGDAALPFAVRQHALEIGLALLDVDVLKRNVPPLKVVTGGLRVGSTVFAEDVDHRALLYAHGRRLDGAGGRAAVGL